MKQEEFNLFVSSALVDEKEWQVRLEKEKQYFHDINNRDEFWCERVIVRALLEELKEPNQGKDIVAQIPIAPYGISKLEYLNASKITEKLIDAGCSVANISIKKVDTTPVIAAYVSVKHSNVASSDEIRDNIDISDEELSALLKGGPKGWLTKIISEYLAYRRTIDAKVDAALHYANIIYDQITDKVVESYQEKNVRLEELLLGYFHYLNTNYIDFPTFYRKLSEAFKQSGFMTTIEELGNPALPEKSIQIGLNMPIRTRAKED